MVQNSSSQTDLTQAECISLDISQKYNLLLLLLNFDKYWSPYSLSDGGLYKEEVKKLQLFFRLQYYIESFSKGVQCIQSVYLSVQKLLSVRSKVCLYIQNMLCDHIYSIIYSYFRLGNTNKYGLI